MLRCGLTLPTMFGQGRDLPANITGRTYDDGNENGYEGQCANMVVVKEEEKK